MDLYIGIGRWLYLLTVESGCEREENFPHDLFLHTDYHNVIADAKCNKLENFFSPAALPLLFLSLSLSFSLNISFPRCENDGQGFFSDFSPPRAWQFSFEGGTLTCAENRLLF